MLKLGERDNHRGKDRNWLLTWLLVLRVEESTTHEAVTCTTECASGALQARRAGCLLTWTLLPMIVPSTGQYSQYRVESAILHAPICCFLYRNGTCCAWGTPRLKADDLQYETSIMRLMILRHEFRWGHPLHSGVTII